MIVGHGIDLQEIEAITKAYERNQRFAELVLTEQELLLFKGISNPKRQMSFLTGRWAAKEAYSKALGTGIGKVNFHDIEILSDDKGAPLITKEPFNGKSFVSISHSGNYAQASVILEEEK
ncbi:TPA: holo-ACP synthase [Streptococcus agalactiae]